MRRFNINEFIWLLILCFNLTILSYLLATEKIFLIINSDTRIYIYIAIGIITLMILTQLKNVFTVSTRVKFRSGYAIFLFSSICLLLVARIDIVKTSLEFKGVTLYHGPHVNSFHNHEGHDHCIGEDTILINYDNFHETMEELITHIHEYIGSEVQVQGIVYKDKNYEGKFIVTSLQLNCCIVDSTYIGILCDYNISDIENGEKVTVKGTINKTQIKDKDNNTITIPIINVEEITT